MIGRRDTNESKTVIPQPTRSEKAPAKGHDGTNFRERPPGQLANALHCPPCIGPLMHIVLACFSTVRKIARNMGVVAHANRKEFASVVKGGRITINIPEVSADLGHTNTKSNTARS